MDILFSTKLNKTYVLRDTMPGDGSICAAVECLMSRLLKRPRDPSSNWLNLSIYFYILPLKQGN